MLNCNQGFKGTCFRQSRLTNILQPSAKVALFCFECRIEASLADQVGVKSGCVRWRSGVPCKTSLLVVKFGVHPLQFLILAQNGVENGGGGLPCYGFFLISRGEGLPAPCSFAHVEVGQENSSLYHNAVWQRCRPNESVELGSMMCPLLKDMLCRLLYYHKSRLDCSVLIFM